MRRALLVHARRLCTSSSKPTVTEKNTWGRLSLLVKEEVEPKVKSQEKYMEQVKDKTDIDSSLLSIQHEVQEEIAAALGRSGDKVKIAMKDVEKAQDVFERCVEKYEASELKTCPKLRSELVASVRMFNDAIRKAEAARIDLIVHRQAVGFTFQNQKYVNQVFPLPKYVTKIWFNEKFFDFDSIHHTKL